MKKCRNCNYAREPGAISPDPKKDEHWCSNSKAPKFMQYISLEDVCLCHMEPSKKSRAAAKRFYKKMERMAK